MRFWLLLSAGIDVLRTSIGRPPTRVSPRKNSPPDCFYSPSCVSLAQEISLPAGSGKGLCPLNPARAARPLTLARALPKSTSKVWRFRPSIASICHKRHMVELYRGSKVNYEGNALRDGILLTSDLQSLRRHLLP